jgi:hypothetical protein
MKNTTKLAALVLMGTAGVAQAGGSDGSIGVGAEFMLSSFNAGGTPGAAFGLGGPSANYDAGKFHVGGFLAIYDPDGANNTTIEIGGRFYYDVHSTAMSDFGLGGSLGVISDDGNGPMNNERNTLLFIEPGFQIRVFLQSNVAISFTAGLAIGAADASGVALIGNANGSAGLHYYFF